PNFYTSVFFPFPQRPPCPPLFPYTTLFRSGSAKARPEDQAIPCSEVDNLALVVGDDGITGEDAEIFPFLVDDPPLAGCRFPHPRSEEHTSELQSRENLVCRLLLEKKKTQTT